jgi:hypothetical protein
MDEFFRLARRGDPVSRRLWLLSEALRSVPLDGAIELARAADQFIMGPLVTMSVAPAAAESGRVTEPNPSDAAIPYSARAQAPGRKNPAGLLLSAEQREQLLNRLAEGATNATLFTEFSMTARQVQGMRMGAAREIARRTPSACEPVEATASAPVERVEAMAPAYALPEDVIRYLRQQDDVVVRQEDGSFLVNARFRLELPELAARANRMRSRQGKPEFRLVNGHAAPQANNPATRHPIFWNEPAAAPAR